MLEEQKGALLQGLEWIWRKSPCTQYIWERVSWKHVWDKLEEEKEILSTYWVISTHEADASPGFFKNPWKSNLCSPTYVLHLLWLSFPLSSVRNSLLLMNPQRLQASNNTDFCLHSPQQERTWGWPVPLPSYTAVSFLRVPGMKSWCQFRLTRWLNNKLLLLTVPEGGSPRSGHWKIWCLVRACVLVRD